MIIQRFRKRFPRASATGCFPIEEKPIGTMTESINGRRAACF
jgi:hypothetical protein